MVHYKTILNPVPYGQKFIPVIPSNVMKNQRALLQTFRYLICCKRSQDFLLKKISYKAIYLKLKILKRVKFFK